MAGAIADNISTAQSYIIPFSGYTIMGMYAVYVSRQLPALRPGMPCDSRLTLYLRLAAAWSSRKHALGASGSVPWTRLRRSGRRSIKHRLLQAARGNRIPTSTRKGSKSLLRPYRTAQTSFGSDVVLTYRYTCGPHILVTQGFTHTIYYPSTTCPNISLSHS